MTQTQFPSGLGEVSDPYAAILCDVWGVIHNGREVFEEAVYALSRFREMGRPVVLITNAPVPSEQVLEYMAHLGVGESAFDACVSSGDVARDYLSEQAPTKAWLIGMDESFSRDKTLYEGLDINFTDSDEADLILCMGLDSQIGGEPSDYRDILRPAVDRKLDMLCANPDIQVRVGDQLIWCAGAIAQVYEDMGGKIIYPGKPHSAIYAYAQKRLEAMGVRCAPEEILCIGDNPDTDLRGALTHEMGALYVGTGINHDPNCSDEDFRLMANASLEAAELMPDFAMPALTW